MKLMLPPPTSTLCKAIRLVSCFSLTLAAMGMPLQAGTWTGGGTSKSWSDLANWGTDPANSDVLFETTGSSTPPAPPTNIVDSTIDILSLTYQYHSATLSHITEITSGSTLNVIGGAGSDLLLVGGLISQSTPWTSYQTSAIIRGDGALVLSGDGKNVSIGNYRYSESYNTPPIATLDLRGLATFTAELGATGAFNIGATHATGSGHQATTSYAYLAQNSSITAGTLRVGAVMPGISASVSNTQPSYLYLNRSTELYVDEILVGVGHASRAAGVLRFEEDALLDNPTLRIRGNDGNSAVEEFAIGTNIGGGTSTTQLGEVDFSGGVIDVLVKNLTIGSGNGAGTSTGAYASGKLTMDRGTFVATKVIVGEAGKGAPENAINSGTLNIQGGQFDATGITVALRGAGTGKVAGTMNVSGGAEVNVGTGGIVLGSGATGTPSDTITAILDIADGKVTSSGNIGRAHSNAAISSILRLRGGELDLKGNAIDVTTFDLESGILRDIDEINNGAEITKTTTGTLTLEGTLAHTGDTNITAGTLVVNGTVTNSNVIIGHGSTLTGTGGILNNGATLEDGSSIVFNLRSVTDYDSLTFGSLLIEGDVNLELQLDFVPVGGTIFQLIEGDYNSGLFSTINGQAFGDDYSFNLSYDSEEYAFQLRYGANGISLYAIPEPRSLALLGLAGLSLLAMRRRNT